MMQGVELGFWHFKPRNRGGLAALCCKLLISMPATMGLVIQKAKGTCAIHRSCLEMQICGGQLFAVYGFVFGFGPKLPKCEAFSRKKKR